MFSVSKARELVRVVQEPRVEQVKRSGAMQKDDALVIERVANGYTVRPLAGRGDVVCVTDIMVFQMMGYASGPGEYIKTEDTLLGFLAQHFTEGMRRE